MSVPSPPTASVDRRIINGAQKPRAALVSQQGQRDSWLCQLPDCHIAVQWLASVPPLFLRSGLPSIPNSNSGSTSRMSPARIGANGPCAIANQIVTQGVTDKPHIRKLARVFRHDGIAEK